MLLHKVSKCKALKKTTPTVLWHQRRHDEALRRCGCVPRRAVSGSKRGQLFYTSASTSADLQSNKSNYSLMSLITDSWDKVFLTRRAVSRAAELAYQHSLISLPITRRAWCSNEMRWRYKLQNPENHRSGSSVYWNNKYQTSDLNSFTGN